MKSKKALDRYNHQLVIANLLHDRKRRVTFIERTNSSENGGYTTKLVELSETEVEAGIEIEEKIVSLLYDMHRKFLECTNA